MKIFAKKKWIQKKLPAFGVLEVMLAGIIFLIMLFFVNQFLSQVLSSPRFQVDSEEVFKKIQNISGYPDPAATPVDAKVELFYQFTKNSCLANESDWGCTQIQLKLPSGKNIFWHQYTR